MARTFVENEAKERAAVTRSQNAMYVVPHDPAAADQFLAPWLQRVETGTDALQLLVVTNDAEGAAALAGVAVRESADDALRVVPVAGPRRAERRVRAGAHVVIGSASELLALVRASALKLDGLRAIVIAWADELLASDAESLEALFAEVPKTAARIVVATEASEGVEALVERYARRPRREGADADAPASPVNVGFVTAAAAGRAAALRRVIDALDPHVARVFVRGEESVRTVRQALAAMGYRGSDAAVTIFEDATGAPEEAADLVVLFDLPSSASALARIVAGARRSVVLVQPRQLASLRRLAQGGTVTPVALPENTSRGQAEVAALRQALLTELSGGGVGRELLVLEPLLEDHDPIELAAAALRLAGRSSGGRTSMAASAGAAAQAGPAGPMTKIFINVGEMDNARPGDLVGAIINEGGAQRDQVGRIDVRDKHAVVEVESSVADQVIERLSGSAIRGRRVQARVDQERPARTDRPARSDRPARGDRPDRGGPPERGSRPARPARSDAGERPSRSRSFDRERPPARAFDRGERPAPRSSDRERPPARGFDRDRPPARAFERPARGGSDRPVRPARDRDDRPGPGSRGGFAGRDAGPRGAGRPPRPRRGDT